MDLHKMVEVLDRILPACCTSSTSGEAPETLSLEEKNMHSQWNDGCEDRNAMLHDDKRLSPMHTAVSSDLEDNKHEERPPPSTSRHTNGTTISKKDDQDISVSKAPSPSWLEDLVSKSDKFHPSDKRRCKFHEFEDDRNLPTKSMLAHYCMTCQEGPLCQYGREKDHMHHHVLKTRVVAITRVCIDVKDLEMFGHGKDYNEIHSFVTNGRWAMYLSSNVEGPEDGKSSSSKNLCCLYCSRSLVKMVKKSSKNIQFCSIGCKIKSGRLNLMDVIGDQDTKHGNCETSGSYKEVKYKALSCDLPCTGTEPVAKSMATCVEPQYNKKTEDNKLKTSCDEPICDKRMKGKRMMESSSDQLVCDKTTKNKRLKALAHEPTGGMSTELEYKIANQSSPEPVVIVSYDVDLKILKLQLPSSMSVEGALNQLQSKWSVQYGEGILSKVDISEEKLMSTSSNGTELKTNIPQQVSGFKCVQVFDLDYENKHFSIRSPIHGFVADFIVDMMDVFYLMVK